jgi:exo-1,4-beta-D-glucosaminidase
LTLSNAKGGAGSRNVYWDSTRRDVLDKDKSEWFYTPESQAADLTGLSTLRPASVHHQVRSTVVGAIETTTVTLHNTE